MPARDRAPIVSIHVEADDGPEDEGPLLPWIPPDDRLWRHPSEVGSSDPRPASSGPGGPRILRASTTKTWSVAVVAGVVGAILASGVGVATGNFGRQTTVVQPVTHMMSPTTMALTASSNTPNWPAIADHVSPSVVSITTAGSNGNQSGSGVLYLSTDNRSYILTSAALIGDGMVQVTFDDSETQHARVVGIDHKTGLGLVSVAGPGNRAFAAPTFGSQADLRVAEQVMAVGARSFGVVGSPVASGSISGLDQAINVGDDSTMEDLISIASSTPAGTDAGGALVDAQGAVFGIQAFVDSSDASSQGQSYAIPMDLAMHVASQMLAGSRVTHPWLGIVDAADPSSATTRQLQLAGGAQVTQVAPGSPAQALGLTPSDVVTSFNGQPVATTGGLNLLVDRCDVGHRAPIAYIHGSQTLTRTITVTEAPNDVDLG